MPVEFSDVDRLLKEAVHAPLGRLLPGAFVAIRGDYDHREAGIYFTNDLKHSPPNQLPQGR